MPFHRCVASSAYLRGDDLTTERQLLEMLVESLRRVDIVRKSQRTSQPYVEAFSIPARPTGRKKRGRVGWLFTQGGGLGGLALGYYHAAPPGRRKGEPDAGADSRRPFHLRGGWATRRSWVSSALSLRRLRLGSALIA